MGVNAPLNRKLRMGLVGGGQGAFIGRVHATAAMLDNRAVLVAGALSSDPAKAKASAPDYDIKPERAYGSYQEMIAAESKLPADRTHRLRLRRHAQPHAFRDRQGLRRGRLQRHVRQADDLRPGPGRGAGRRSSQKTGVVFAVTHNYTGYPLVRQARDMVQAGELGEINAVRAFYIQGWLRTRLEAQEQKQAAWRTDPEAVRRRRLLRRHRHPRLQPGPLHHRPACPTRSPAI